MQHSFGRLIAAFLAVSALAPLLAREATAASPAEVVAGRQESIDHMLSPRFQPELIANGRRSCVSGGEPAHVEESRAGGAYFTPDAVDGCVTMLIRTARDRRLPELYRGLLTELGGDVGGYDKLPRVIGAAVLGGKADVQIGNRKVMTVTPAISFDAGFTVAYLEGSAAKPAAADPRQLRALAEACLRQKSDAGTCFSAGYVYGARAFTQTAGR